MRADITLEPWAWHDLYAAAGIAPGSPLLVINKSVSTVYLWEGPPVADMALNEGVPCYIGEPCVVSQVGESGCYVAGMVPVRLSVQEYTE